MKTKSILVVDDDAAIRDSLKKLLDEAGYSTVVANDGREGAAALAGREFDLLILDLDLPKVSGWDILDTAALNHPLLPIIILTGLLDQCEPGSTASADAFLEKPPDVPLLLKLVEQLLDEPAEARLRRSSGSPATPASASYTRWFTPESLAGTPNAGDGSNPE